MKLIHHTCLSCHEDWMDPIDSDGGVVSIDPMCPECRGTAEDAGKRESARQAREERGGK